MIVPKGASASEGAHPSTTAEGIRRSGPFVRRPKGIAWTDTPSGSPWQGMLKRFLRHRLAVASLFILAALYLVTIFAEFVAPYGATHQVTERVYSPPQLPKFSFKEGWHVHALIGDRDPLTLRKHYTEDPSQVVHLGFFVPGEQYKLLGLFPADRHFFGVRAKSESGQPPVFYVLGADKFGRDIFSRIIFGARVSLTIGLVSIVLIFVIGLTIGGVSGYVGGWVDMLLQRLIEMLNAIPQLPLWLALAALLPAGASPIVVYLAITLVLGVIGWADLARVVRGKVLSLREEEFVTAARLIGASPLRILVRHIFPGLASHVLVVLTMSVPSMILGETSLSFLGLGLKPPAVSWGVMLHDTMSIQSLANYPWLLSPAVFIVLTVLCFNFLGDGLRDTADPSM